jgi:hypothetical protein
VATLCLVSVGEYVEYRPTVRRSIAGLLGTFFVLSSLTYFFKEYAFSRGVLLMTIGSSAVLFTLTRGVLSTMGARRWARRRRILLVGMNDHTQRIADALRRAEHRHADLVGVVATAPFTSATFAGLPVVGDTGYLDRILDATRAQEVILTDPAVTRERAMDLMMASSAYQARFHLASEYDDIVTARIINDVAGVEPTVSIPPLMRFRNRVVKRLVDLVVSSVVLTLGAPALTLLRRAGAFGMWLEVFAGTRSVVGLHPDGVHRSSGKPGMTGLVQISGPDGLSRQTITHLNDYYVDRYTIALDVEIILKHLIRRNRGKHSNS